MIKQVRIISTSASTKPTFAFRNINELMRTVEEIRESLSTGESLIQGLQKALAARTITINVDNESGVSTKGITKHKTSNDKVEVKAISGQNQKKIQANFTKLTGLLDKLDAITSIEAQLNYQFRDDPTYKTAKAALVKLRADIQKNLKSLYIIIDQIASAHVPTKVAKNTKVLFDKITADLHNYDTSERKVIVDTITEGNEAVIRYTAYLCLYGMTDASDYVYNSYFVIMTSLINEAGAVTYFVTTSTQFKAPGNFNQGHNVTSLSEAQDTIEDMLRAENFTNVIENIPFPLDISDVDRSKFDKIVDDIKISDDNMAFTIKGKLTTEAKDKLVRELWLLVKGMVSLKTKGGIKYKVSEEGKATVIKFFYTLPEGVSINVDKYQFKLMQDTFNLSDAQVKRIQQVLV